MPTNPQICFKCKGTGLKPCKLKDFEKKVKCPVCGGGKGLAETPKRHSKEKPVLRLFKGDMSACFKRNMKPLYNVFNNDQSGSASGSSVKDREILSTHLLVSHPDKMITSLCGDWLLLQYIKGHRITTDDCFIAALVVKNYKSSITTEPPVTRYLDLGTGLGSVLQLVAWGLDLSSSSALSTAATLTAIEAQKEHVEMARYSTSTLNNCQANIIHADLRDFLSPHGEGTLLSRQEWVQLGVTYDLITGTPPYFPTQTGVLPRCLNRALCAFEMRGDVGVYLQVASLFLSSSGSCFIANGGSVGRTVSAGISVGFRCLERWDLRGKMGKPVLFSVYRFEWARDPELDTDGVGVGMDDDGYAKDNFASAIDTTNDDRECIVHDVCCRDCHGQFTQEYQDLVCTYIGKPRPRYEPASAPRPKT